jgi:RimJ/RimL family protein N-acetyltransferase
VPAILYPDPPLTGETFVLRRFRARDFDAAVAAREDREAARWVNAIRFPAGGAMARFLEAQRRRGTLLHFAIVDQVDGGYLGEILLFLRSPQAAELDIGEIAYVIAPAARGRGIAPEAVRLLSGGRSRCSGSRVFSCRSHLRTRLPSVSPRKRITATKDCSAR